MQFWIMFLAIRCASGLRMGVWKSSWQDEIKPTMIGHRQLLTMESHMYVILPLDRAPTRYAVHSASNVPTPKQSKWAASWVISAVCSPRCPGASLEWKILSLFQKNLKFYLIKNLITCLFHSCFPIFSLSFVYLCLQSRLKSKRMFCNKCGGHLGFYWRPTWAKCFRFYIFKVCFSRTSKCFGLVFQNNFMNLYQIIQMYMEYIFLNTKIKLIYIYLLNFNS